MNERKEPLVEKLRRVSRLIGSGMQEYHLAGLLTSAADEIGELQQQVESLQAKVHLCAAYDKLEAFARKMWIQANGDDEFFEDAVLGPETTKLKCCPGRPAGHDGDCSAVPIRGETDKSADPFACMDDWHRSKHVVSPRCPTCRMSLLEFNRLVTEKD